MAFAWTKATQVCDVWRRSIKRFHGWRRILRNWDYPWVCDGLVCKMPISVNVFLLIPCSITFLFYSGCLVELRRQELEDSLHHAAKCFISACANIGLKRSASCITIETHWSHAWRVLHLNQWSAPTAKSSQRLPDVALLKLATQTNPIWPNWSIDSTRNIKKHQEMKIEKLQSSRVCTLHVRNVRTWPNQSRSA